jgi:transcription elongation factor S-II
MSVAIDELASMKASLLKALGEDPSSSRSNNDTQNGNGSKGVTADYQRAIDILTTLLHKSPQIVNVDTLAATKIGVLIAKLRRHSHAPLQAAAKTLVGEWKTMVRTPSPSSAKDEKEKEKEKDDDKSEDKSDDKKKSKEGFGSFLGVGHTGDSLRNKVQQLFSNAIGKVPASCLLPVAATTNTEAKDESISNAPPPGAPVSSGPPTLVALDELAVRCESALFTRCKGTTAAYKAKSRDLCQNISNPKNEWLRADLYLARLAPEIMVGMTSQELADPQLKAKREKERQYNTDAKRSDYNEPVGFTDQFQCEKCRQSKCTFFQMQTRGSDEPMTIFVTCLVCGYKFRSGDNS